MSEHLIVEVEDRTVSTKNENRRLRREARVPGVVYGLGKDPFTVTVSARRINEILHTESGRNTIFHLALAGKEQKRAVMIKDLQRDPVTSGVVHVDFIRLDMKKMVTVNVPVRLLNTPEGVKNEGGVMDFIHRELSVECLPGNIPEHLDIDVGELHINQHVSVKDVAVEEGFRILDDAEMVLAVVVPPKAEAEAAAVEEEAAPTEEGEAEPEVIKKGKEAGEEGAAPSEGQ